MVRDAASTAGKGAAGKRSVIVLNPVRRPSLTARSKSDPEVVDIDEPPESDDPAVIRRIVRRQAALASAAGRKATLAAIHQKRSTRKVQHPGHALSSIPFSAADDGSTRPIEVLPSPGALAIANERFDPFANQAVDFDAIKDSGMLHSLFHVFMAHVAPLLDLRLPTQEDRRLGRRYSWQNELPQMALASPPCFWALMLAASGQMDSVGHNRPAMSMLTLKFRHMTIRSITKRLDASSTGFRNDFGLLIGIAILGSWEHWWGSPEACRAHCDGLRMLRRHFHDAEQPHDLFAQVMTFANTFGSHQHTAAQEPKYAQPLPKMVEARLDVKRGFEGTARRVYLDARLVRSICGCGEIEKMPRGSERAQTIRELASVVLSFNTKPRLRTVFAENDWSRDHDGDRINLEMHTILQAAAVSLLNHLAGSAHDAGTENVDVLGMCDEVADLGRSVVCLPVYDHVLLWALVTILALSRRAPPHAIAIIRTASHRLQMQHAAPDALETSMEAFVFLRTAREHYVRFWSTAIGTP